LRALWVKQLNPINDKADCKGDDTFAAVLVNFLLSTQGIGEITV
jgi:hypothetical protein